MCGPQARRPLGRGSGNSGTIFSRSSNYDNTGNIISLSTTQAAGPHQSDSGGSEMQNFYSDQQYQLVWAVNSGTLASGLNGASYSNSYVYTHLGQLWQGPLAGGSAQQQYRGMNIIGPKTSAGA